LKKRMCKGVLIVLLIIIGLSGVMAQNSKPLVLQEMTWVEVEDYLRTHDIVIIPIGSTEQHGPHLPLGTDYYEAMGISKLISQKTGVLIAPVLLAGYSVYHSGFPGTLSLKPETLEQVLFETVEMLMQYGFKRFLFFNYHGGNNVSQDKVIHRINHSTEATAVSIGVGSSLQKGAGQVEGVEYDHHAGIKETSNMLYLYPDMVQMDKAEKPVMTFSPLLKNLMAASEENPNLETIAESMQAVPLETGKYGASHEISSNGIWSTSDPKSATREIGEKRIGEMVDRAVKLIESWNMVEK